MPEILICWCHSYVYEFYHILLKPKLVLVILISYIRDLM